MASQRDLQEIFNSGQVERIRLEPGALPLSDDDLVTKAYSDLGEDSPLIDFVPQSPPPDYREARLFYDQTEKGFVYYNEQVDMSLVMGQEQVVRVWNGSGATILNGSVCRADGASGNYPSIVLALANDLLTARILGIATHDIEDQSYGYVTHGGKVNGVDMTGFSPGDTLFLSDTVPGGFQLITPDIVSVVGNCLIDGPGGSILVGIANGYSIPTIIGAMIGIAATYTVTTTPQKLVNWGTSDSVVLVPNPITGEIFLPTRGVFRGTVNFSASISSSNQFRSLTVEIFDVNDPAVAYAHQVPVGRDSDSVSGSFAVPLRVAADNHYIAVQIYSSATISDFTFNQVSFDFESIHI